MEVQGGSFLVGNNQSTRVVGEELTRYLGPEFLSYRPGQGGKKLAYVEGHEVINLMNRIFGWEGWSSKAVSFDLDYAVESSGGARWSVGTGATVKLTVRVNEDGKIRDVSREDCGYGTIDNAPTRGNAMEKCRKEAMTDGLKRVARQFGNATGNCLYNKEYLERVKKVKGPAARIDFVDDELFRKPMNKRQRFMVVQDRERPGVGSGQQEEAMDDEFGDSDSEEMLANLGDGDELITVG